MIMENKSWVKFAIQQTGTFFALMLSHQKMWNELEMVYRAGERRRRLNNFHQNSLVFVKSVGGFFGCACVCYVRSSVLIKSIQKINHCNHFTFHKLHPSINFTRKEGEIWFNPSNWEGYFGKMYITLTKTTNKCSSFSHIFYSLVNRNNHCWEIYEKK